MNKTNTSKTVYNVISYDRYNTVCGTFKTEAAAIRFAAKLNRKPENHASLFGAVAVPSKAGVLQFAAASAATHPEWTADEYAAAYEANFTA